jgi:hypothetical protein
MLTFYYICTKYINMTNIFSKILIWDFLQSSSPNCQIWKKLNLVNITQQVLSSYIKIQSAECRSSCLMITTFCLNMCSVHTSLILITVYETNLMHEN